jgi:hypothetical protein
MRTWKSWLDDGGAGEIGISAGGGGLRVRSLPAGALEHADMTTDSAIIPALLRRIWALTEEVSDYEDRQEDLEIRIRELEPTEGRVQELLDYIHEQHGGFRTVDPRLCADRACQGFHVAYSNRGPR